MAISANALIDLATYNLLAQDTLLITDPEYADWESNLNLVTMLFEQIANRSLKAQTFSYLAGANYNPENAIFDGPKGNVFFFPTYPVNSITTFLLSGVAITEAATDDFDSTTDYYLYKHIGKLMLYGGFDYGYSKNIQLVWNGGYSSSNSEYAELQRLTYLLTKYFVENDGGLDSDMVSETLGRYKYTKVAPTELAKTFNIPPFIYRGMYLFRRHPIA